MCQSRHQAAGKPQPPVDLGLHAGQNVIEARASTDRYAKHRRIHVYGNSRVR